MVPCWKGRGKEDFRLWDLPALDTEGGVPGRPSSGRSCLELSLLWAVPGWPPLLLSLLFGSGPWAWETKEHSKMLVKLVVVV